ncbi:unnamed protein product [Urochloa humidicola]
MPHRISSSWYTAVSGCVRRGLDSTAFSLLRHMQENNVPLNGFVPASLITVCERRGGWEEGTRCHPRAHPQSRAHGERLHWNSAPAPLLFPWAHVGCSVAVLGNA